LNCKRRTDTHILSADERQYVVAPHNGWRGFLYPFLLPADHAERVFGMDEFLRSGSPKEIYQAAGFDTAGLHERFRKLAVGQPDGGLPGSGVRRDRTPREIPQDGLLTIRHV
jgi:hypothetical protein